MTAQQSGFEASYRCQEHLEQALVHIRTKQNKNIIRPLTKDRQSSSNCHSTKLIGTAAGIFSSIRASN